MNRVITYKRVSTDAQGNSGLGIAAQEAAIAQFLSAHPKAEVIGEFTEIESGKRDDRPELRKAIALAKRKRATLVVAKLDRLARNLHFITALMQAGIEFCACDLPAANKLVLHIMASFAEFERDQISERTKAALRAAKQRGIKLGGWRPGVEKGAAVARERADAFAANVRPIIIDLRSKGVVALDAIATELNRRNIPTARGGEWHPMSVKRIIERAQS